MKTTFSLLFWVMIASFALGQQGPERKGFVFGAAAGLTVGSLSGPGVEPGVQAMPSFPNIKLGYMVGPKTAVCVFLPGVVYRFAGHDSLGTRARDRGFEGVVPGVQHWIGNRWWVMGGAGLGLEAPAFYDIQSEAERNFYVGVAALGGVGYEFWQKRRFAADVQVRAHAGRIPMGGGVRTGAVLGVLVGVNWY
jgi:hypothetical protein